MVLSGNALNLPTHFKVTEKSSKLTNFLHLRQMKEALSNKSNERKNPSFNDRMTDFLLLV